MKRKIVIFSLLIIILTMNHVFAVNPVTKTWDWEDATGTTYDSSKFSDDWVIEGKGASQSEIIEENNNNIFSVTALFQAIYDEEIAYPYEISYKIRMGRLAPQLNNGFFFRAHCPSEREGVTLNFFEDAKSAKAPGDHVAGSGMSVVVKVVNDKPIMRLTVKTYNADTPLYVGNEHTDIILPEETDLQTFHTIKIKDDGSSKIEIFFDEQKMATVTMSNIGVYAEDIADTTIEYYKTVKITDATGTEIFSNNNARLCKTSLLAFTSRNQNTAQGISYELDDVILKIDYPDNMPTPEPTPTATEIKTSTPNKTNAPTPTISSAASTNSSTNNMNIILISVLSVAGSLAVIFLIVFIINKKTNN